MTPSRAEKKELPSSKDTAILPVYADDFPPVRPLDLIDMSPEKLGDYDGALKNALLQFLSARDYSAAIEIVKTALKTDDTNTNLMNLVAALHMQAGQMSEAEAILSRALKRNPHNEQIINNLACAYMHRGLYQKAEQTLSAGLQHFSPQYAQYHYNLSACMYVLRLGRVLAHLDAADAISPLAEAVVLRALLAKALGDTKAGEQILIKGALQFPGNQHLSYHLAAFLYELDQYTPALSVITPLVSLDPHNRYYAMLYANIARTISFQQFQPPHAQAIANAFQCPGVNTRHLESAWSSLLLHHPVFSAHCTPLQAFSPEKARDLINVLKEKNELTSAFLLQGLPRVLNRSTFTEIIFPALRQAYLDTAVRGAILDKDDLSFLSALSVYCHHNEYVFDITSKEQESLDTIRSSYAKDTSRTDLLVLLCTYGPITDVLSEKEALELKNNPLFETLITEQILDRKNELALMKTIPALTPIHDDISRAVEQMYLENPYPTWINVNYSGGPSFLHLSPNRTDRCQMLIAGCGTGQHSITAALTYENCEVLAIDLSRRSLAYALRKTQEMGLTHIRYAQADILELGKIKQKFDIVESAGVIHHMADPLQGLKVLIDLLKPGGLLRLGLYSEIARKPVVAARAYVKEKGYPPTLEGIRAFRRDVLDLPDSDPMKDIMAFGDFFSTSTCRDLVFHVQEHRYTIPQLKKIFLDHGLEFATFNLDFIHLNQFKTLYPNPEDLTNLDYWADFEEKYPRTFASMYQFWVKKPI